MNFFVDTINGCDESGDGTLEKPFKTCVRAREESGKTKYYMTGVVVLNENGSVQFKGEKRNEN